MDVLARVLCVARNPAIRFWGVIALLFGVQCMAYLLMAIPDVGVRKALAYPYAFTAAMALTLAWWWLMSLFRTLLSLRKVKWQEDLPREVCAIALTMDVARRVRRYGIMPNWSNAAAVGGDQVVVGERLLAEHQNETIVGVVAHEFAHIRRRNSPVWWTLLAVAFAPAVALGWLWWGYPPVILLPGLLSAVGLSAMTFYWLEETGADNTAASFVGADVIADALEDLRLKSDREDGPSFTHPSLRSRILRMRRRVESEPQ